jgi:hypothetical protein
MDRAAATIFEPHVRRRGAGAGPRADVPPEGAPVAGVARRGRPPRQPGARGRDLAHRAPRGLPRGGDVDPFHAHAAEGRGRGRLDLHRRAGADPQRGAHPRLARVQHERGQGRRDMGTSRTTPFSSTRSTGASSSRWAATRCRSSPTSSTSRTSSESRTDRRGPERQSGARGGRRRRGGRSDVGAAQPACCFCWRGVAVLPLEGLDDQPVADGAGRDLDAGGPARR